MKNTHENLISIIMPVYNGEIFICEAITSVLKQSYSLWELIIVDDGSIDNSKQIIHGFKDPRIKYFYQANAGVSSARNKGLKECSGEYICFLDADDIFPQESLKSRFEVFENGVDFVDGSVDFVDIKNKQILYTYKPNIGKVNPRKNLLMIDGSCFMGISWMIRATSITHFFKDGLTHGEDLLFLIQNTNQGLYLSVDSVILRYRQQESSAMSNLSGLEDGYLSCWDELGKDKSISVELLNEFKSKSRSIMFKSYLKKGMITSSLKTLFKFK